jgi:hypothetical protein
VLKREFAPVQRGEDPKGVVRDPDHAMIDTNLEGSLFEIRTRIDRLAAEYVTPGLEVVANR